MQGVQRRMVLVVNFFRNFEIEYFSFIVAIFLFIRNFMTTYIHI